MPPSEPSFCVAVFFLRRMLRFQVRWPECPKPSVASVFVRHEAILALTDGICGCEVVGEAGESGAEIVLAVPGALG